MSKKIVSIVFSVLVASSLIATQCAAPTPETIIQTVVVEKEGEKVVETVVETVEVVKEVEVVVTATPDEAPEPEAMEEEITLVYVTPSLALTMDPVFLAGDQTAEVQHNLYNFWTENTIVDGPDGIRIDDASAGEAGLQPGLFESWELSEDATVYTMHLRKDIVDSYGNQLKAEDAKWVFDRLRGTEAGSTYVADVLGIENPDQVTVIDDYTLEFRLSAPNAVFLRVLTVDNGGPFGAASARQHATDADPWATEWLTRNAPATGPYMLESWTAGIEQVLVKNPNYYGPEPAIDRVIYRQVEESANRVALLLRGEADIARDLSMDEVAQIEDAPGVKVVCYPGNVFVWAAMHWDMEPTSNQKVREALAYAVPYQDIYDAVYRGFAKPLYGWVTDGFPDFLGADAFPYTTDYEKAKELLAEAGYPDGFDLEMVVAEGIPEHERIAVLLKDSFGKIGVNLSIDTKPMAAYRDVVMNRQAPIMIDQNYSIVIDANYASFVWLYDDEPPSLNASGFRDPEFNELQDKAVGMPDGPERAEVLKRMQERFYELTPWLPLANPPTCYGMSDRISNFTWHFHNDIEFRDLKISQ